MTGRIFRGHLTGRYYYATRVKDRGNGTFEVIGNKVDVTLDVEAEILQSQLIQMAAKATALPKFPNERFAPSREDAMTDFNNSLLLAITKTKAKL